MTIGMIMHLYILVNGPDSHGDTFSSPEPKLILCVRRPSEFKFHMETPQDGGTKVCSEWS